MSMRITGIRNLTFQNNNIRQETNKQNKGTSKTLNAALGLTTLAGLGSAVYFVKRKPANIRRAEEAQKLMNKTLAVLKTDIEQLSDKIIKSSNKGNVIVRYTSKAENTPFLSDNLFFNQDGELFKRIYTYIDEATGDKVIKIYKCKNPKAMLAKVSELPGDLLEKTITINKSPLKSFDVYQEGGFEELTYITKSDGTAKTLQKFFNKNNKLHEMTIYNEKISGGNEIIRYDYAYDKEGNIAGFAREDITQGKEYVPMSVKMFDGSAVEAKYVDDLYTTESKFNPDNF